MTQNTQNRNNINNTYGEQHAFAADEKHAAARHAQKKGGRYIRSQATAMALVLTVAFAVSAVTAVVVSNFAKGFNAGATTTSAVALNAPEAVQNSNDNVVYVQPSLTEQAQQTVTEAQTGAADAPQLGAVAGIFTASGQTSTGYDWNYSGDSNCAVINCQYDFSTHQYNFTAQGACEGVDHVQLMYMTADNTWASQAVTVTVDRNLNVSVA